MGDKVLREGHLDGMSASKLGNKQSRLVWEHRDPRISGKDQGCPGQGQHTARSRGGQRRQAKGTVPGILTQTKGPSPQNLSRTLEERAGQKRRVELPPGPAAPAWPPQHDNFRVPVSDPHGTS